MKRTVIIAVLALASCGASQKAIWQSFGACEENAAAQALATQLSNSPSLTAASVESVLGGVAVATAVCAAKLAEAEIQQALGKGSAAATVSLKHDPRLDVLDQYIADHEQPKGSAK